MPPAPDLLGWLAPPAFGGVLGYATLALLKGRLLHPAARARRRPARQRGEGSSKLALEMGELVATELLSEEAIRRQLAGPQFRESVRRGAASITSQLLGSSLRDLAGAPSASVAPLGAILSIFIEGFLGGESAPLILRELLRAALGHLARRPLSELVEEGSPIRGLFDRAVEGLTSDESRARLRGQVARWIEGIITCDVEVAEYLGPEDMAALAEVADSLYPPLVDFVVRWLRSDATRTDLAVRGRFLVRDILGRLTGIQRIIVSAAQFDRTLEGNMEGIVADALDAVEDAARDPETQKRLGSAVRDELRAIRSRTLAEVVGTRGEVVVETASAVADRLLALLSTQPAREGLIALVTGAASAEERAAMTVGDLLSGSLTEMGDSLAQLLLARLQASRAGGSGAASETGAASEAGAASETGAAGEAGAASETGAAGEAGAPSEAGQLGRPATAGAQAARPIGGLPALAAPFFASLLEAHAEERLGDLLGLAGERKERLDDALAASVVATVESRLSEILAGVDFRTLVARKIDEIDSSEIAGYFLEGLGPQLRWIPLAGALAGALIGLGAALARLL